MDEHQLPPIVGIGASAGGITALRAFFGAIPADSGAAFVVVMHFDPTARSELTNILGKQTSMPVMSVEETMQLQGDRVYVIAPNRHLQLSDHTISAPPFDEDIGRRAPIDVFFRSLAQQKTNAYAIILTGAGADGAMGVRAIKEAGGIVLVQDPAEAEYPSMPRNAIATQAADFILPLAEIAVRLPQLLRTRLPVAHEALQESDEETIRNILMHVRARTGHDFNKYKRATVLRRIGRRTQIVRAESLADYYTYLRNNAEEVQALFTDFLISVTTFFRDGPAFKSLAQNVIPRLYDDCEAGTPIRVWVPGCATGEEAYSVGILLLEEAARRDIRPEIQIFGSDLDDDSLVAAREGRYPPAIECEVGAERLRRFFTQEGEHYRVRRELRDIVLFAAHSLLRDPPFSRLDLLTCRNLLIYLDRELQQQACSTFHYALNPGGYLLLGTSESAESPAGLFRTIDREARIYQSVGRVGDRRVAMPSLLGPLQQGERSQLSHRVPAFTGSVSDAALHRQLLERVAPPSMLVDETHHAVHLSEKVGRYLQPAGGSASTDAMDLVRSELRFDLWVALHRAFERGETTLTMPIPVQFNGAPHRVYMQVKPVVQPGDPTKHALILFFEGEALETEPTTQDAREEREASDERIRRLQEELQFTQARLRATREEAEGANEELRAANEELQSINEEYRSTAEELETSKEELQSINEELQTVNIELKLKLDGVSRAHSDLQNLMAATDVGTLFLDPSLRIKRFTPRLTDLFNVTVNDEGRPITDFTNQLDYDGIADLARRVLRDLTPLEQEVQSRDRGCYLVRIRPYRTLDDKIDGVVATFLDITGLRRAEEALRQSEDRLRSETAAANDFPTAIFVWERGGGIVQWNKAAAQLFGYGGTEALGNDPSSLLATGVRGSSMAAVLQALDRAGEWNGTLLQTGKDGRVHSVESQLSALKIGRRRLVVQSSRPTFDGGPEQPQ